MCFFGWLGGFVHRFLLSARLMVCLGVYFWVHASMARSGVWAFMMGATFFQLSPPRPQPMRTIAIDFSSVFLA